MKLNFSITLQSASAGPYNLHGSDFARDARSKVERLDGLLENWPADEHTSVSFSMRADLEPTCQYGKVMARHVFLVKKGAKYLAQLKGVNSAPIRTEFQHFSPCEVVVVGPVNQTLVGAWTKVSVKLRTSRTSEVPERLDVEWPNFINISPMDRSKAELGTMIVAHLGRLLNIIRWSLIHDRVLTDSVLSQESWNKITVQCEDPWAELGPRESETSNEDTSEELESDESML